MSTTIMMGTTMAAICPPSNLPTLASTFPPPVIPASEVGFVAPEVGFVAPEVGFVAPEVGFVAPEVGFVAPEVGFVAPEVGFVAPEVGFVAPEVGVLVPPARYGERESNAHVRIALWIHIVHCVPLALYAGSFTCGKRK